MPVKPDRQKGAAAKPRYVLAIDLGSSGPKSAVVSAAGKIMASAAEQVETILLPNGGAEQKPEAWWAAVRRTANKAIRDSRVSPADIAAVSCDSQFSVVVPIDENGKALMNAIHWMDSRGAPYNRKITRGLVNIKGYGLSKLARWVWKTGLAPTQSGVDNVGHIQFIRHERPEVYRMTWKFLEPMDYINLRLTGRCVASQETMAAFLAVDNRKWGCTEYDDGLLKLAGIERDKLPDLVPNQEYIGTLMPSAARELGLSPSTRVIAGTFDTNASAIGSGAVRDFDGIIYIGTSLVLTCFVPFKKSDLIHTITTMPGPLENRNLLMAEQLTGGKALDFYLRNIVYAGDGFKTGAMPDDAFARADRIAGSVPAGSGDVIFMPWLNGTMTPEENGDARGGFFNLSLGTNRSHLTRAVLESLAYNNRWTRDVAEKFIGRKFSSFRFAGGGALSDIWAQIHADVLGVPIHRVIDPSHTTVRGAAMLALHKLGALRVDELPDLIKTEKVFTPNGANRSVYDMMYRQYRELFHRNKKIFAALNGK